MRRFSVVVLAALILAGCADPADAPPETGADAAPADSMRIVALGGSVAETIFALGAEDRLIARDLSAVYPEAINAIPSIGYYRMIGAEGVLSTRPTLVLADPNAGPPTALEQIEQAGVTVTRLPGGPSPDSTAAQVRAIADALGLQDQGETLVDSMRAALAEAQQLLAQDAQRPRVLLVLDQEGRGRIMLAGRDTNADTFIRLAGGENAFGEVPGYQPLAAEALIEAQPEVIIMLEQTAAQIGGPDAFRQRPEVAATPAAQNGRIIVLPNAALNFGPGLGRFVLDFARELHGASPTASAALTP
jgi:iron complex transport system substrate-binding protein